VAIKSRDTDKKEKSARKPWLLNIELGKWIIGNAHCAPIVFLPQFLTISMAKGYAVVTRCCYMITSLLFYRSTRQTECLWKILNNQQDMEFYYEIV
jgi:hypothetical protein